VIFLRVEDILLLHEQVLSRDGGEPGVLHPTAIESAVVAVRNRAFYEDAGPAACAAAYLWHLTRAHAFVDGNKRVAVIAAEQFLVTNGATLRESDDGLFDLVLAVADGTATREEVERALASRVG
jgi:death on curing protein